MRIICVDDEELVLQLNIRLCMSLEGAPEVFGFSRAHDALSWLNSNSADVALLDINMPDMNGLVLAAHIKELSPDTAVIFATGFAEFAVDAFAMHAEGYLLKPISKERLAAEIAHVQPGRNSVRKSVSHIAVRSFGNFDLFVDGIPVSFPRAKAKELLAYLVDRQGSSITRAEAFAVLWEDADYDRAMQKQLDVVIRSLRTTLEQYGVSEILDMRSGSLRVRPELIDCDMYHFMEGDISAVNAYRGEYMTSYSWAELTEAYMERQKLQHSDR